MRIALTLVMVCGCVASSQQAGVDRTIATYPTSSRTIEVPQLLPSEWRIGQWATYKAYVDHAWTIQSLRVVAKDECGIWIETVTYNGAGADSWLVCFRDDRTLSGADRLRTAIGSVNGTVTTFQFEHGTSAGVSAETIAGFLDAVTLNTFPEDAPREDIAVRAGHFTQALRIDEGRDIRWVHPDVPFNGTIKRQRSGVDERVLLGFGESTDRSEVAHLVRALIAAQHPSGKSLMVGLGLGFGWLTAHSGESSRAASAISFWSGLELTEQLDLLGNLSIATVDVPETTRAVASAVGSLRWNPFGRARLARGPIGASALYVRAGVGYAGVRDSTAMDAMSGVGLDAAIGWVEARGRDYTMSFELADHLAVLADGYGTRNYIAFGVSVEVFRHR